ncbi:MAG: UDP-3-O-[3-hydroxymyristoyl] N-acetylglucosamine deacetylase [Candidatus Cloacimonetes bacterium]|nr:UDP-3-O-[3-hydroxymyristoyl] N-acetylglucosamine deacetylase [Candidatus Cloacimonadota bacterium]
MNQKTLKKAVTFKDIGLHTGQPVTMVVKPAPPETGIIFIKTHKNNVKLKVSLDHVEGVSRGTNLTYGDETIYTFEHLNAAIAACNLTNLEIELDADEPPILDGSAIQFYDAFKKAGIEEQDKVRMVFKVVKPSIIEDNGAMLMAYPDNHLSIDYVLSYPDTYIGTQHVNVNLSEIDLGEKLLKARTFCLLQEVELQRKIGQALGGSLDNALVVDKDKLVNKEGLRFENEFAWHKILDFFGDMNILGAEIKGRFVGIKSGHRLNSGLLKKMLQDGSLIMENPWLNKDVLELQDIKTILPHRYPFLLVDRIIKMDSGKTAVGIKSVTGNEEFFNGHFPDTPIMPGVLIVEALAQVGGVCLLSMAQHIGRTPYFMGLEQVKFRRPVRPGDQLELEVEVLKVRGTTGKISGKAKVNGKVHVEGKLSFMLK